MRLVKISAPAAYAADIAQSAFDAGIESVSTHSVEKVSPDGSREMQTAIQVQTSTPRSKRFVENVVGSRFYNSEEISINIRQPRTVLTGENVDSVTKPLAEPGADLLEELWQFSHITYSLVGRVLIGACLVGYGLIGHKILLIIGGLLFLPLLPILLSIGFGVVSRQWKLALQGLLAFAVSVFLLVLGGAIAAMFAEPPLKYDDFSPFAASLVISAVVGAAAGLASIDDVGRRELIGLAAAAQIGLLPVWLGVCIVFGSPPTATASEITTHIVSLVVNSFTIMAAAAIVHLLSGVTRNLAIVRNT